MVGYIFIGYNDKKKVGNAMIWWLGSSTHKKNVVFDKSLVWWPSKDLVQLDMKNLEAKIEESIHDQVKDGTKALAPTNEEDKSPRS